MILFLAGCGAATAVSTHTAEQTPTMTPLRSELRYLALGDSYTIGESVAVDERWPVQLVAALRAQGMAIGDPEIIAKTGWTTAELAEGIAQAQPQGPYDLVSLLIGVNNQYRGLSQEQYRDEFVGLLETAVTLTNNNPDRVFVVSIPDWGVTPFGQRRDFREVSAAIDAFNAINRAETESRGIVYIDITPISRQAPEDRGLIADDGLHPSGEMYRQWVELILPEAKHLLLQE
ncbi:MAG: SGNH/GDSL hydrolase family protein [Anaerolineales bacterium]|nr:SGNH/GDSL hydrolase family protein [Anaerolineales bacterium]